MCNYLFCNIKLVRDILYSKLSCVDIVNIVIEYYDYDNYFDMYKQVIDNKFSLTRSQVYDNDPFLNAHYYDNLTNVCIDDLLTSRLQIDIQKDIFNTKIIYVMLNNFRYFNLYFIDEDNRLIINEIEGHLKNIINKLEICEIDINLILTFVKKRIENVLQ